MAASSEPATNAIGKELLEADAAAANQADPSGYRPLHVRIVRPVCHTLRSATRPTTSVEVKAARCGRALNPWTRRGPLGRTREC